MEGDFVKELYDYVNTNVLYHVQSAENLKDFLRYLAGMRTQVSITNKVLTFGYNPEATDIRTKEAWERMGFTIKDEGALIHNIQHNREEPKFSDRKMYDISSTDAVPEGFERFPDAGFFAERLILISPCPILFLEQTKTGGRKAFYNPEKGVIEVTRGFRDEKQVCYTLLREYAHFFFQEKALELKKDYDRDAHDQEAVAVVYAVCVRYGMEPPQLDVIEPPTGLKSKDVLDLLGGIDHSLREISRRIDEGGRQQRRFLGQESSRLNSVEERIPDQGRG